MVMGWKNILQVIAPDLAVFDHSPTANLGSRSISMKRAFFGTGFYAPPQMSPMPTIRPWLEAPLQRFQSSENRALQAINPVLERIDAPVLEKLMNLFDCDENFLTTFPELDHYQERGSV